MKNESREAPWRAGLRAARANVVPGLLLQLVMVAMLVAYFHYPPARDLMVRLAEVKTRWGYVYSALAAFLAGAVIPELLRVMVFQKGRFTRGNLSNFVFASFFWMGMGLLVDAFYRLQAKWWGDEAVASVVIPQVLVDQFLFSPFITAPLTVWLYDWKLRGYHVDSEFFTFNYYKNRILPTLVAIWGVWIPVATVLYALPEVLQIPLFSIALSLWVLIYTWMSEEKKPDQ